MSYLENSLKDPTALKLFQQERLKLDISVLLWNEFERSKLTIAELSRRTGLSRQTIRTVFDSEGNATLETVASILMVLGKTLVVSLKPLEYGPNT